jgi:hypothetical protein
MLLSNWAMDQAAAEVRGIAASMTHAINELDLASTWSGRDADRFQRDWHDLVNSRLIAAANKLDGISFEEILGGFDGQ